MRIIKCTEDFPKNLLLSVSCNRDGSLNPSKSIVIECVCGSCKPVINDIKVDKQMVEHAICAMVLGVDAPDEILIECQRYLYDVLGWKL